MDVCPLCRTARPFRHVLGTFDFYATNLSTVPMSPSNPSPARVFSVSVSRRTAVAAVDGRNNSPIAIVESITGIAVTYSTPALVSALLHPQSSSERFGHYS